VDHVGGGHQEAHLGAHRQHQRLVDFEQVVLALGFLVVDLVGGGGQVAEELDVLAQVFVVPLPLVAGDLDIDIRLTGVVDVDQGRGRGNGHGHQDQKGTTVQRISTVVLSWNCGHLPGGAAVHDHRPEHRAKDDDADHHTDPENGHVQVEYSVTDFSRPRRHIHSPGGLRLAENRPQQEAHPDMWMSHHCGFPLSFLLSRRLSPAARERLHQTTNLNRRALLHLQSGVISESIQVQYRQRLTSQCEGVNDLKQPGLALQATKGEGCRRVVANRYNAGASRMK
jgi:hypothetical protein